MEVYTHPIPSSTRRVLRFVRLGLNELPQFVNNRVPRRFDIAGITLNCRSTRMKLLFVHKEWTCRCCGIKASFAAVERSPSSKVWKSLNFYGYDWNGQEVLLTWDHIKPRSLGGRNTLQNSQTLCVLCNTIKGNDLHFREIRAIRQMRGLPIQYEYKEKGEIWYWWNGKTYTSNKDILK